MSTSKARYEKWASEQVARSTEFVACRNLGTGQYEKRWASSLAGARQCADTMTASQPVMIYAVTPDKLTVYVETRPARKS